MWIALAGGGLSVIASMAVMAGLPGGVLFVYFAPLPLMLVGLGWGVSSVLLTAFTGIILSGILGGTLTAGIYAAMNAVPAYLVTDRLLSRRTGFDGAEYWPTLGPAIAGLSVMAAVILIAGAVAVGGDAQGAPLAVSNYLSELFASMAPSFDESLRTGLVEILVPLFPGTAGASWILMLVINAALAQKILRNGKRNIRPSPALGNLELPNWLSLALVGTATISLLGAGDLEYIGRNLTIVFAAPFFFLGLAVVHYAAKRVTYPGTLLSFFYFVLFVSGWAPMVVVGIGLFEQWAGLRMRFSGPPTISGDE